MAIGYSWLFLMNKAFFVDTNILVSWLYYRGSRSHNLINEVVSCINKGGGRPKVLEDTVEELATITSDAYLMAGIILKERLKPDWDVSGLSKRAGILEEILVKYDEIYEETYDRLSKNLKKARIYKKLISGHEMQHNTF
ncbi:MULTISPECIES: hypothetical protein [Metallosphaera]|nr:MULTISPECIES: hypothetical protein [Metallosphaera]MCY0861256.1 hypothetical protein [Metallosphaera prunae]WPX07031.1 hypothetical protein SOJ17_000773 [Metallosphaera sedula DSM 5348]